MTVSVSITRVESIPGFVERRDLTARSAQAIPPSATPQRSRRIAMGATGHATALMDVAWAVDSGLASVGLGAAVQAVTSAGVRLPVLGGLDLLPAGSYRANGWQRARLRLSVPTSSPWPQAPITATVPILVAYR